MTFSPAAGSHGFAEAAQARTEAQKDELDKSKRQIDRDRDDLHKAGARSSVRSPMRRTDEPRH